MTPVDIYAHGVDFSAAGNRQIPANTGGSLNLRTIAGSDSTVLSFPRWHTSISRRAPPEAHRGFER